MKVYSRLIATIIVVTFIFLLLLSTLFFLAFPLDNLRSLWTEKVWEVPFLIIVPTITILFGILVGVIVAYVVNKRVRFLEQSLSLILKNQTFTDERDFDEIHSVHEKLKEVQDYIQQQTKRAQKLIEERAKDQEDTINQVISEERNRLARELHDSVSQELFAASMLVSAVNASNHQENATMTKQLSQVEAMIQQAQLEMRALLLHLRPVLLKDKSLKEGMEQLLQELRAKVPMEVTWKLEDIQVNKGIEDHLFRILQEGVSNALRHSKARSIDTLLIERDGFAILKIEDDGIGFNIEEKQAGSYGIINMQERTAEIGGYFRIISIPEKGTRIEVRVPMIEEE